MNTGLCASLHVFALCVSTSFCWWTDQLSVGSFTPGLTHAPLQKLVCCCESRKFEEKVQVKPSSEINSDVNGACWELSAEPCLHVSILFVHAEHQKSINVNLNLIHGVSR